MTTHPSEPAPDITRPCRLAEVRITAGVGDRRLTDSLGHVPAHPGTLCRRNPS